MLGGVEKVSLRSDVALERHDDFFANGIDSRICHLREQLFEVVVDKAWLIRKTG